MVQRNIAASHNNNSREMIVKKKFNLINGYLILSYLSICYEYKNFVFIF